MCVCVFLSKSKRVYVGACGSVYTELCLNIFMLLFVVNMTEIPSSCTLYIDTQIRMHIYIYIYIYI